MTRHDPEPPCPNEAEHTPSPDGYLQWWSWCERMNRTHEQRLCAGCGTWAIWYPRPAGMLAQCWRCAERKCNPADFGEDEEMLCATCVVALAAQAEIDRQAWAADQIARRWAEAT